MIPAHQRRDALRRAKSTSSIVRPPTVIDPVAARQHALVAATVAYERSCGGKENFATSSRTTQQQQLRRKRSNRISGFEGEGSHFHEPLRTPRPARQRSSRKSQGGRSFDQSADAEDEQSSYFGRRGRAMSELSAPVSVDRMTEARDFAAREALERMPNVGTVGSKSKDKGSDGFAQHRSSISVHKLRKAKSMYSRSSDGHVRASSIDDISFGPPARQPPLPPPLKRTVTSIQELNMEDIFDITTSMPAPLTRTNLANVHPRPHEFGLASSKEFTTQSIRHRASMMLTPFKKRRGMIPATTPPPMPQSDPAPAYASVIRPSGPVASATPRFQRNRAASEVKKSVSIRFRIRSVFHRSSSNPLQELPMQQVNASRAYFGNGGRSSGQGDENALSEDVLGSQNKRSSFLAPPVAVGRATSPGDMSQGTKSRVTSWADSTVAGTILEALDEEGTESSGGEGTPKPSGKFSTMSLIKRLRRMSKVDMRGSEDRITALSISSPIAGGLDSTPATIPPSRKPSGRALLPNQVRHQSIRAVQNEQTLDVLGSYDMSRSSSTEQSSSDRSAPQTIRGRGQVRKPSPLAIQATPPSAERIAARVRRSDERWQEPLDGGRSLFFPRSPKRASHERSSSQVNAEQRESDDVFSDDGNDASLRVQNAMSPSVYSEEGIARNFDAIAELSALPHTPLEPGNAIVHHVARYSVGSPKKSEAAQSRKASKDWRSWIETETRELESPAPEELDLKLSTNFAPRNPNSGHHKELAQIMDDDSEDEFIGPAPEPFEVERTEETVEQPAPQSTPAVTLHVRKAVPAMVWRPTQPPRIIQHTRTSESSVPSTTMSSRVRSQFSENQEGDRPGSARGISYRYRYDPEDRPSSRLNDIDEGRPSSCMNDRFPYMETSRPGSRASGHRAATPAKRAGAAERNKENIVPSPATQLPTSLPRPRLALRGRMSSPAIRTTSALAHYTTNQAATPPTPQPSLLPRPVQSSPRRPMTSLSHTNVTRRAKHISMPSLEADPTLASILQGPYREQGVSQSPQIRRRTTTTRDHSISPLKENSAPSTPKALEFSDIKVLGGPATPTSGQRLAEQFLNARRFREDLNVVSPGQSSPASDRMDLSMSDFGSGAFL